MTQQDHYTLHTILLHEPVSKTHLPSPATQCVAIHGGLSPSFPSASASVCLRSYSLNRFSISASHSFTIVLGGASPSPNTQSCTLIPFSSNGSLEYVGSQHRTTSVTFQRSNSCEGDELNIGV
ncbi:hypothetical protein BC938DRAFT_482469 [Jimgerdemannia flammicorona]|uniref:Uncharacterized protein n=1 Tax=Jimgerdemannia flammicorona TaxID=994334 RepID=A0A433QE04_9FUNG|nr:hypothetical protein BC938DRAFT_482469 [Jimgerdemannia flammicorona]